MTDRQLNNFIEYDIPFFDKESKKFIFPYRPVRDVVFLWKTPEVINVGGIIIPPDQGWVGGSSRENLREPTGIVMSFGDGYVNSKGRFVETYGIDIGDKVVYNKRVPWRIELEDHFGKKHELTVCGFMDLNGVVQ